MQKTANWSEVLGGVAQVNKKENKRIWLTIITLSIRVSL
jgi:hypothetical protein